jgi:hypothetical protein
MAALSAAAGTPDFESDAWVVSDLAATVHLSEHTIGERLNLMRRVGAGLPLTWEALNAGQITPGHVFAIDAVTRHVSPELAQQVEAIVLPRALDRKWTPGELRAAARKQIYRFDPEGARERAAKAKQQHTDVKLFSDEDEMSRLVATGDAWTNRRLMDEINRRADALKRAGDPRPLGELRFAALSAAMLDVPTVQSMGGPAGGGDDPVGAAPALRPRRAQAHVTVDLATLVGLRDEPGHLAAHGPITADLARRIAADASLRLLVLSPVDGKPVGLGRKSYQPSAEIRRWVETRDRTCIFPGCACQAIYCDVDHREEWDAGGTTDCDNCGLLCRKHHNYKTSKAWDLTRSDDGTLEWLSPYGHRFTVEPQSYDDDIDPDDLHQADEVLPPDLSEAIPEDEWERRWESWPRAG